MYTANAPSTGPTKDVGLGFDFSAWGEAFKQIAPAATQIYAQKAQIDMQKKLAQAQALQQAQQQQAQYYRPSVGRGFGVGGDMPGWVIPAALAGGGLLLVTMLMRRR